MFPAIVIRFRLMLRRDIRIIMVVVTDTRSGFLPS
jgi:hypothetical protein